MPRPTITKTALLAAATWLATSVGWLTVLPVTAGAATQTNGPVTLSSSTPASADTPYSNGEAIDVGVAANATLSRASLAAAGYPSGVAGIAVQMCAAPNGAPPTSPTNEGYANCDQLTNVNTQANPNGSLTVPSYPVYALPDASNLSEGPGSKPACGLAPNFCVLYLGTAPTDLSKPHLWSAPFQVGPSQTQTPAVPTSAGAATTPASAASGPPELAYTGVSPAPIVAFGLFLVGIGWYGRRRFMATEP